jgi:hypothetical protein
MFNLKRNRNYYAWTPWRIKRRNQWKHFIIGAVSRCSRWLSALKRYGRNFICFVARWALVTDKHTLCPKFCYQSMYVILFGTSLSGHALRSDVQEWTRFLLVNTPCSHLHRFLRSWREQRPSNQGDLNSSVTEDIGRVYYTGVDQILILFFYRSTWFFLLRFKWYILYLRVMARKPHTHTSHSMTFFIILIFLN